MTRSDPSKRLLKTLRKARVGVFHPPDEDGENLEQQLRRIGCQVTTHWPPPSTLVDDLDVVFFLDGPDYQDLHQPYSDSRSAALVAIVEFESPLEIQRLVDANIHGTIAKPIQSIGVLACMASALGLFRYESRLTARIDKLDEMLKTRRTVERATQVLASHRNVSEDEAYVMIRREAMNKQITIYEMATSVLNADQFFTGI